jgi:hypothetical protein
LASAVAAVLCWSKAAASQIPDKFENLKALPADITRDSLVQTMRGFSFALGVRCQYCHAGGDGVSFAGVSFASDDKIAKRKARFMIAMVDSLNHGVLGALPGRSDPPVSIQCVTCHRGLSKPTTLEAVLAATIERAGVDSAVTQFKELRQSQALSGTYDFTEWRVNELARHLATGGKTGEAITILEMNAEFNPRSASIPLTLGDLHRQRGERDKAIQSYRRVLELDANNQQAKHRLVELGEPVP